ncbi:MAG: SIS domain-containing protein [Acidimicrobiales bacterium]
MAGPGRVDTSALRALGETRPELASVLGALEAGARLAVDALGSGGTLFLAGNGGSMADALHIAGELKKSFERPRPLPGALRSALGAQPGGDRLAGALQGGLRVVVLGADPVLATAIDNDLEERHLGFAQELAALGRPKDALVVLSTSGRSVNVTNAAIVARALAMPVLVLTGEVTGTPLVDAADVVVRVPATQTAAVQGYHSAVYHALCRVLEDTFFPAAGRP